MSLQKIKNLFDTKLHRYFFIVVVFIALAAVVSFQKNEPAVETATYENKYVTFLMGLYDTVDDNYWKTFEPGELENLYVLGIEKINDQPSAQKPGGKKALVEIITLEIDKLESDESRKQFSVTLADVVLANLQPFGRSRLYSQKQATDLKNTLENRDLNTNQYDVLGVSENASAEEIESTYTELSDKLLEKGTPEAETELAQLDRAFNALSDEVSRQSYDESGIEPTMETRLLTPQIFYIKMSKFSPTMVEELKRVTEKVDDSDTLDTLILDLRDNIGGLIDGLPYFLGPFIGLDQYAYQFFQQDEKEDFKTVLGWLPSLVRYKKVVILINGNTQSSAEVMVAALKTYNVGVVVGTLTKGWGTVEKVFELENQLDEGETYSAFLAHHLTLRGDGQPIEGRGVDPMVNINDSNWEDQLLSYFNFPQLVTQIKGLVSK